MAAVCSVVCCAGPLSDVLFLQSVVVLGLVPAGTAPALSIPGKQRSGEY